MVEVAVSAPAEPPAQAPRQITTRQHVYSRSGLRRFAGPSGRLHVVNMQTGTKGWYGPDSALFVVDRAWDQRSENRTMSGIERQFGIVAKRILHGGPVLDASAHAAISKMYSLWRIRHHRACNPLPDTPLNGVLPGKGTADAAMDQLEHYGIVTMTPDGKVPGRMMAGPLIQLALDRQAAAMAGKRWGIVRAAEGEFVLPDTFGDYMVMPLSPTCCLVADQDDGVAPVEGVAHANAVAKANATAYLAARDLAACPGI